MSTLTVLPNDYVVCKLPPTFALPPHIFDEPFYAVTRTHEELSLVVRTAIAPPQAEHEGGWRVVQVLGPLDFSLTGILAALAQPLAEANISIFALSTFNTDYLLLKAETLPHALEVLVAAGHRLLP